MLTNKRKFKSVIAGVVGFLFLTSYSSAFAATYPPSIQPPKVGEPIQAPAPTLDATFSAIVPIAKFKSIPVLVGSPISLEKAAPLLGKTKKINVAAFNKAPIRLETGLILGGVPSYQVSRTPLATVSSSKKSEVQTATNVPTRISVTGLKKNATASVSLLVSYASQINLFTIRVSSKGVITLPPLTIQNIALPISLQVSVGTQSYTIPIRALK